MTVAALDLLVAGRPGEGEAQVAAAATANAVTANAVLADEWSERVQSEKTWRSNRGPLAPGKAAPTKPSHLQGPPQQPGWHIAPAPANPWMNALGYNDRDTIGPFGLNKPGWGAGGYRTVCVRSCDGYFFPISYGASELNFSRDQATCTNSCSGAKLYYYRAGSEGPEEMVDLSGQKYARSRNAGLFRTQYVEGCKCKPHPWEQEANDRHRIYALEDQRRKGNRAVVAELESLKSKNRLDNRSMSQRRPQDRRRDARDEAAAAPRSDVSRGQSADRVVGADAQSAVPQPPGVVTGAVAAAASAATVQSVTSRMTASAPVHAGANRDALHPAAIQTIQLQPGAEPMAAPAPAVAQPVPLVAKSAPPGRGRRAETHRNEAPAKARSGEWARQVFNP